MLIEFVLDLLYFPIWWYTGGVKRAGLFCIRFLKSGNVRFAPGLWLKNIFVPMYGQYDLQGRLVSIFMRLANVIGRSIALFFWLLISVFLFLLWLAFPIFVVYMLLVTLQNFQ